MKIAFATPEVLPFSKTGGLADVSRSLATALAGLGCEVTVFTPFYSSTATWFAANGLELSEVVLPYRVWIGDEQHALVFKTARYGGLSYVFPCNDLFYERPHCYLGVDGEDYPDNAARFAFFCRAVLEYCLATRSVPDIFHAHDWQAALLPVYLETIYRRPELARSSHLLTIHNMGYQGLFPAEELYATGLSWEQFTPETLEYYGKLNLLKGGIVYARAVNTVSPSYSIEIQTEAYGHGLHGIVRANHHKMSGILNGVDTSLWNPATDPFLPAQYSAERLGGKARCKRHLQRSMGLPLRSEALLLGMVSRFDGQKGIDLVLEALPAVAMLDIQLVMLGSGQEELERSAKVLEQRYAQQVVVSLGFDEGLAHLIEAGSDAFLMPSRYEPCGLSQMYSQIYGTVPIVRETGGLRDTVRSFTPQRLEAGKASGFTFRAYDAAKLAEAIRRAAKLFHTDRRTWQSLVQSIMRNDFSWNRSAKLYLRTYRHLANHLQQVLETSHG